MASRRRLIVAPDTDGRALDLNLHAIFRIARRWWWLLLLAPLVAGLTAYWASSQQEPLYSASATLLINQAQQSDQQQLAQIQAGERLGATYQRLVSTDPIINAVIARLGLPFTPGELRDKVSAGAETGTQLLRVSVSDTDPERAAAIANAVAEEFPFYLAEKSTQLSSSARDALNQQIANVDAQITDVTGQIQTLESGTDAGSPTVLSQIASLRTSLNSLQVLYGDLLSRQQQMQLDEAVNQNRVTVWEQARVPTVPYAPRIKLYTALALFAGIVLAIGGVMLLEYLDNTVKSHSDFAELVGAPLLSSVSFIPKLKLGQEQLFTLRSPQSASSEAIRLLRTNIEFAAASREIASLTITSPGPSEGKSTVTANLAVTMAQAGFSAVVIDADLRRPSQHKLFGVQNQRGLTTLLTHPEHPWRWASVEVMPGKLFLIPSGPLPPNPADLLASERMRDLIRELKKTVDIVLIDTPPILAASDPLVLAPDTDGVVLISRAGRTRRDALRLATESLNQGGIRIVGVVLNQNSTRESGYYYYSDYYAPSGPAAKFDDPSPISMRNQRADTA
ncbi:MAG: tyrosine-protein kinase [Thermomicrobiales bacterium]|nr:tyrosine-protein kinase [Thermomicrobiales bacterium]